MTLKEYALSTNKKLYIMNDEGHGFLRVRIGRPSRKDLGKAIKADADRYDEIDRRRAAGEDIPMIRGESNPVAERHRSKSPLPQRQSAKEQGPQPHPPISQRTRTKSPAVAEGTSTGSRSRSAKAKRKRGPVAQEALALPAKPPKDPQPASVRLKTTLPRSSRVGGVSGLVQTPQQKQESIRRAQEPGQSGGKMPISKGAVPPPRSGTAVATAPLPPSRGPVEHPPTACREDPSFVETLKKAGKKASRTIAKVFRPPSQAKGEKGSPVGQQPQQATARAVGGSPTAEIPDVPSAWEPSSAQALQQGTGETPGSGTSSRVLVSTPILSRATRLSEARKAHQERQEAAQQCVQDVVAAYESKQSDGVSTIADDYSDASAPIVTLARAESAVSLPTTSEMSSSAHSPAGPPVASLDADTDSGESVIPVDVEGNVETSPKPAPREPGYNPLLPSRDLEFDSPSPELSVEETLAECMMAVERDRQSGLEAQQLLWEAAVVRNAPPEVAEGRAQLVLPPTSRSRLYVALLRSTFARAKSENVPIDEAYATYLIPHRSRPDLLDAFDRAYTEIMGQPPPSRRVQLPRFDEGPVIRTYPLFEGQSVTETARYHRQDPVGCHKPPPGTATGVDIVGEAMRLADQEMQAEYEYELLNPDLFLPPYQYDPPEQAEQEEPTWEFPSPPSFSPPSAFLTVSELPGLAPLPPVSPVTGGLANKLDHGVLDAEDEARLTSDAADMEVSPTPATEPEVVGAPMSTTPLRDETEGGPDAILTENLGTEFDTGEGSGGARGPVPHSPRAQNESVTDVPPGPALNPSAPEFQPAVPPGLDLPIPGMHTVTLEIPADSDASMSVDVTPSPLNPGDATELSLEVGGEEDIDDEPASFQSHSTEATAHGWNRPWKSTDEGSDEVRVRPTRLRDAVQLDLTTPPQVSFEMAVSVRGPEETGGLRTTIALEGFEAEYQDSLEALDGYFRSADRRPANYVDPGGPSINGGEQYLGDYLRPMAQHELPAAVCHRDSIPPRGAPPSRPEYERFKSVKRAYHERDRATGPVIAEALKSTNVEGFRVDCYDDPIIESHLVEALKLAEQVVAASGGRPS